MIESSLSIFFCMHTKEAFTPEFDTLFSEAKITVIENGFDDGTTTNSERAYNKLSLGQLTLEQIRRNSKPDGEYTDLGFYQGLQTRISKSGRTIVFEHSPLTNNDLERWALATKVLNTKKEFKTALPEYRRFLKLKAADERKRNDSLARQLQSLILLNSGKSILLVIGAGHERPLRELGLSFTSHYMVTPMKIDIQSELMTRFELMEYVSDFELLQAMAENFMHQAAGKSGNLPHAERVKVSEKVRNMSRESLEKYVSEELKRE